MCGFGDLCCSVYDTATNALRLDNAVSWLGIKLQGMVEIGTVFKMQYISRKAAADQA